MDEVFGSENFVALISFTRQDRQPRRADLLGTSTTTSFGTRRDKLTVKYRQLFPESRSARLAPSTYDQSRCRRHATAHDRRERRIERLCRRGRVFQARQPDLRNGS